jgi:hypothetical protein
MEINIEKNHVFRWMWSQVKTKAIVRSTSIVPHLRKARKGGNTLPLIKQK